MADGSKYVRAWFKRAAHYSDPFDKFVSLWLALVIAARSTNAAGRNQDDAPLIRAWFESRHIVIKEALTKNKVIMESLSRRRGPEYGHVIMDHDQEWFRESMQKVSQHYLENVEMDPPELVRAIANLFIQVRNNLFHGEKDPERPSDIELVGKLAALLKNILSEVEPSIY